MIKKKMFEERIERFGNILLDTTADWYPRNWEEYKDILERELDNVKRILGNAEITDRGPPIFDILEMEKIRKRGEGVPPIFKQKYTS